MNSIIRGSGFMGLALCGLALVACDSIKDVRQSPTYATPPAKVSITGKITGIGVGTNRPLLLQIVVTHDSLYSATTDNNTTIVKAQDGSTTRTTSFSLRGVTALNFGSLDIGATYAITVISSPLGRTCTPDKNFSGTVTAEVTDVEIKCVRDATPLYHVTANIASGIAAAPPPGFKLTLTTEEGVETVVPTVNQTSVTFQNPVFYPAANPPPFAYAVAATYVNNGTTENCTVTNPSGSLGTLATGAVGDITNVSVTSCTSSVTATVSYNAPAGGTAQAMGAGGVTVGLKDLSGAIVSTVGPISAFSVTPVPFPGISMSNASALYEATVTSQPAGQFCTVDNGGLVSLVNPANLAVQVRCRNIPITANQLTGTYQVVMATPTPPTGVDPASPHLLAYATERHFMTFFANGTFIVGFHYSTTAAGTEGGFYDYNPTSHTLAFTVSSDSINPYPGPVTCSFSLTTFASTCPTSVVFGASTYIGANATTGGLTGLTGYVMPSAFTATAINYGPPTFPALVTATGVVKTAALAEQTLGTGLPGDPILAAVGPQLNLTLGTKTWTLVAQIAPDWKTGPYWPAGEMNGSWGSIDSEQVWVYNDVTSYGWHAGVNGAPNLQDVCFGLEQRTVDFGYDKFYSRRVTFSGDPYGGTVSCSPGGIGGIDVPNATSNPPIVPGFAGRMFGSSLSTVLSPSPIYYKVVPGTAGAPDTLTIQNTLNETPIGAPLVFTRSTPN